MSHFGDLIWVNLCGETSGVGYLYEDGTNLNSTTAFYAMGFCLNRSASLASATINLSITGSPSNIVVDLCTADAAGLPNSASGVIATTTMATPVAGLNTITFASVALSAGVQYFVVVRGNSTTNYVRILKVSQGAAPNYCHNTAAAKRTNMRSNTTTGDSGWGSATNGQNQLYLQFTDGSWYGSPLYSHGSVVVTVTAGQWYGNNITLPDAGPDIWLSAVHVGCRTQGTLTNPSAIGLFENNNLIAQHQLTVGSAITNDLTGNWANRMFYFDVPVRMRAGNRYMIGLLAPVGASGSAYIQLTGAKCMADKHQCLPLSAVRAYRTAAGVLVEEPGYLVGMALGIDLVNPFAPKPINRRQFNAQR